MVRDGAERLLLGEGQRGALYPDLARGQDEIEDYARAILLYQGDLNAKVGAVMYCSLTAQGSTTAYPVKVQVDTISGTQVHFNIKVSKTPGHFTS